MVFVQPYASAQRIWDGLWLLERSLHPLCSAFTTCSSFAAYIPVRVTVLNVFVHAFGGFPSAVELLSSLLLLLPLLLKPSCLNCILLASSHSLYDSINVWIASFL